MQRQTTFIDSHAVEGGPQTVSSALDLEDLIAIVNYRTYQMVVFVLRGIHIFLLPVIV